MKSDELLKLKKDELVDKLIELSTTEVGKAIEQRDAAYATQGEQATRITDLEVELGNKNAEVERLTGELQGFSDKLKDMATEDEKNELQRQVDDLSARLTATEATKGDPRPIVNVGGKQMIVVAQRFRLPNGKEMTAKELVNSPETCEMLIKTGSSILKEVPVK
jgi:uncharacterized coiled-coil protein SlyX